MSENTNCVFCKIAAGEIPSTKVFEDDVCMAFLDIGPVAQGHTLLIPKTHAKTIGELDAAIAGKMLANLPALVRAVMQAAGCEGVNVLQNNGAVAHQAVGHVHFHIIPRGSGDQFHFNWPAGKYPPGRIEELARKIVQNLK